MDNDISDEVIQLKMQETRASLTEKLETLEQKVVGTVENATAAVTETVDAIKESVHDTVATVQEGVQGGVESVKDLFDVPAHVQRRPWVVVGGSVAVGYCLGALLMRNSQPQYAPAPANHPMWMSNAGNGASSQQRAEAIPPAPQEPSIWASEVAKLKGLALGVLFGTAREFLVKSMPPQLGEQIKEVVDSVTKKVGGDPLPSSDWAKLCEETPLPHENEAESLKSQQTQTEAANLHPAARRW